MPDYITVTEMIESIYDEERGNEFGSYIPIDVVHGCLITLYEGEGEFLIWEERDKYVVNAKHLNTMGLGDTLVEAVRDALNRS